MMVAVTPPVTIVLMVSFKITFKIFSLLPYIIKTIGFKLTQGSLSGFNQYQGSTYLRAQLYSGCNFSQGLTLLSV